MHYPLSIIYFLYISTHPFTLLSHILVFLLILGVFNTGLKIFYFILLYMSSAIMNIPNANISGEDINCLQAQQQTLLAQQEAILRALGHGQNIEAPSFTLPASLPANTSNDNPSFYLHNSHLSSSNSQSQLVNQSLTPLMTPQISFPATQASSAAVLSQSLPFRHSANANPPHQCLPIKLLLDHQSYCPR